MKIIIILICISLMYSCYDEQNLGDNYFYLPMYKAIDVVSIGSIIYKSPTKNLFRNILRGPKLISIDVNEDYILAVQKLDTHKKGVDTFIIIDTEVVLLKYIELA